MTATHPDRWHRRPGTLWLDTLGGVVALAPDSPSPLRLSPAASVTWRALSEPRDVQTLLVTLEPLSGAPPSSPTASDLERLLEELARADLVLQSR